MSNGRYTTWVKVLLLMAVLFGLGAAAYHWLSQSPDTLSSITPNVLQTKVSNGSSVDTSEPVITPVKSENDKRSYAYHTLDNGLRVLLISDPATEMSAAALDVATGSRDDPEDRQGLAHFLEHMLFLGTAKYPQAGEYQAFVSAHGGQHNAFTSLEQTNYFFDVDPDFFPEALDRFAQFFVAPLFTAEYVDREKNAVHSEYQARIRDDGRRLWDVYRELYDPANPASTFSVGSLETLADNDKSKVRDDLVRFYEQHYSANTMTLVVLGKQPVSELLTMVQERFSPVVNRQLSLDNKAYPIFNQDHLPARVTVQSVKNARTVHLVFPMPSMDQYYRKKPDSYIAYLLGHEGEDSLFYELKKQGLAERLAVGSGLSNRFGSTFNVDIALTEKGYQHVNDVVMLFFQAVDALRKNGVTEWQYQEQKKILDLSFRFYEKQDAVDYTSNLAMALQTYAPTDVLRGDYMMESFDEDLIQKTVSGLKPENLLMVVSAPTPLPANGVPHAVSRYYKVPYQFEKIDPNTVLLWSKAHLFSGIKMPGKNPFIPDQLKLKATPLLAKFQKKSPVNIAAGKKYTVWFLQDQQFNVPKSSIMVYARSPHVSASVKDAVMAELFVRLLNDHLNAMLYTASLGGLDFAISKRSRGIAFQLTGYSDKQGLLLKAVLDTFRSPLFTEERFQLIKTQYAKELENASKQTPYQQLMQDLPVVLAHGYWSRQSSQQELASVQLLDVQNYVLEYTRTISADILVYGNVYEAEALKLTQVIDNSLNLDDQKATDVSVRVVELPPVTDPFLFVDALDHNDSALVKYFQAANDGIADQVKIAFLAQILKAPFFDSLRTQQQTGYIVNAGSYPLARVPGLLFLVQSPTVGVGDISKRIDTFVTEYFATLSVMSVADFESQRQALLVQLQERPKSMSEQSMEFWSDMTLGYTHFDYRLQQAEALKKVTQQEMVDYYRTLLMEKNRRQLMLVSPGKTGMKNLLDGSAQHYIYVDNVENLKSSMPSHSMH